MTANEMRELLEYDAWATRKMLEAAATLSNLEWARDLNGPRTSLRQQLVHLAVTVDTYRAMLQHQELPQEQPEAFAEPASLAAFHDAVRERMSILLNELSPEALNTVREWHKRQSTLHVAPADVLCAASRYQSRHLSSRSDRGVVEDARRRFPRNRLPLLEECADFNFVISLEGCEELCRLATRWDMLNTISRSQPYLILERKYFAP